MLFHCVAPSYVSAELKTVTVVGEHRMATYDTVPNAQRLAVDAAKSQALEDAVTYLSSVPAISHLGLNREELRAYTAGFFDIRLYPSQATNDGSGETISVTAAIALDSTVTVRQLESVMENERAKTELTRIRDKIDAYHKELADDGQRLAQSKDAGEAKIALQHRADILNMIDTEEELARTWTGLLGMRDREGQARQQSRAHNTQPAGTPDNAEEHRKKGALLTQQGNYDAALVEFLLALRIMPDLDRAHLGIGAALQGKGDLEGAMAEYRTVLQRHPNDPDAHNNLGSALQQKGDLAAAIAEYRTALDSRPGDALTHFNLGTALSSKGQADAAIEEYRTAIRINPDFVQAYFDLGSLLKDTDQTRDALEAFQQYLSRAPNTPANQPWIEQARTYLEKNRERQHDRGGRRGS
jgi:tetratricopeptide (TPR) repeat protein